MFYSLIESSNTEDEIGDKALQFATMISFMPTIKEAFATESPEEIIQPIAEEIRMMTGAEFVVIGNTKSIRYSHPTPTKVGKKMIGGDNDKALLKGQYYISKATGSLGPSLRGKAPIFNEKGEIIGIVSVGFMIDDVKTIIFSRLLTIGKVSFFVLLIGVMGGILLARDIRKDILGLEPYEIVSLYRDRDAILASVHEGIIAIDEKGMITMMNQSAKSILGITEDFYSKGFDEVFPELEVTLKHDNYGRVNNQEFIVNQRHVIINVTPIIENDSIEGAVISFRDKTEIKEMIHTLAEVRKYSEDLRAQTHEYTNKLYVLSGLLQLEKYDEAIDLLQIEASYTSSQNKILFEQIKDPTVQALLLGKLAKSSELKIELIINPNSYLNRIPNTIKRTKVITIIGNLLDNALEAVIHFSKKEVTFFAIDIGDDIIFEIADSGPGITNSEISQIFNRGYSTKRDKNRGHGLALVKETLSELNGQIEINHGSEGGMIFSVFIPK
ncbi:ATP-binding protein [Cerasibacillus terrae]|uniref:ATP-binding protein n=1 Tax=Cerasibacillus terrae TaxID=2498845 RepID=UPI001E3141DC|nr:sensor histidine kinase [Cerasibacillus terrae]